MPPQWLLPRGLPGLAMTAWGQPPQAVLSLLHLQDVLDEWITAVRHTRPQEALRHPLMLRAMLSFNEMWRVLPGAGAVPLPLDAQHFAELLPVRQVMGQIAPLAARPVLVEDRVHDLPQITEPGVTGRRPRHPVLLPGRGHRLDQRPLHVR